MTDERTEAGIRVAVQGIRVEARKWFTLSDRMAIVARLTRDQALNASAFTVSDITGAVTATDLAQAYNKIHLMMIGLFDQATVEFDRIGAALHKCADWYEQTDDTTGKSFDRIARS